MKEEGARVIGPSHAVFHELLKCIYIYCFAGSDVCSINLLRYRGDVK